MANTPIKTILLAAAVSFAQMAPASAQDINDPSGAQSSELAGRSHVCVNASRGGLSIEIPGLTETGKINGPLRLFKLKHTIREIPVERITEYVNDGESISMKGLDEEGTTVMAVTTYDNDGSIMPKGRVIQVRFKEFGMIAFTCKLKN